MIERSSHIDLGRDKTRIKDPRDAERQSKTVDAILDRMFHPDPKHRKELQILADEVGMGKTFVALATAYSILENMRDHDRREPDLKYCRRKVLIITPQNPALYAKWGREVKEFVNRSVLPEYRASASQWFSPIMIDRLDDLAAVMNKKGPGPRVIVISMGLFGSKFRHYDLKRRLLLAELFRYWGNRLNKKKRERLLRGAPETWPRRLSELGEFTPQNWDCLPLSEVDVRKGIDLVGKDDGGDALETLLEYSWELAEPYTRDRSQKFGELESLLNRAYRRVTELLIVKRMPLVIVDEAHNWKNGPTAGTYGYEEFARYIAPRTRRALLLTATPFQLRPDEILEIMKISDVLEPAPTLDVAAERREALRKLREDVIRPVLDNSAQASRIFARAWARLPKSVATEEIQALWDSVEFGHARAQLLHVANELGVVDRRRMHDIIEYALAGIDPGVRKLLREGLKLFTYNADLSQELGSFVIRHRRGTVHRSVSVGNEYGGNNGVRADRHVLHANAGLDVRGAGELPHYLLMRCVSEMKKGHGKSSLGSALTGCYSTLLHSAEGHQVQKRLAESPTGQTYLDLLLSLVTEDQDADHPKVKAVIDETLEAWQRGEKTLIFCFRANTARRLRALIDERIRAELEIRKEKCLGSPEALKALRTRLTARNRDLVPIALDRVLWSMFHVFLDRHAFTLNPENFYLTDEELRDLARLAIRFDVEIADERVDRVFLNRATEHIVSRRLLREFDGPDWFKPILRRMATLEWIEHPYGIAQDTDDDEGEDSAAFDERGVHTTYVDTGEPVDDAIDELAIALNERRDRVRNAGRDSIFDTYATGSNLWLGVTPQGANTTAEAIDESIAEIHRQLFAIMAREKEVDWHARLFTFQALRRALLRESVLLRLLPTKAEREQAAWSELLVEAFYQPLPQQLESMADRIAVFLEDINAASGSFDDANSQRYVLYDSTKLKDSQFVALVGAGSAGDKDTRNRIFTGFNTPLLPEVLVCTSVGQEGIDLHRHCRHVVHFDLAWNPAVMEQRTGRVDRIGSKTFRERARGSEGVLPFLEVGVPFLAGTYDERMYEELRLRAQTFEVLTGGDMAADNAEGDDQNKSAEGESHDIRFQNLPGQMVEDLRARLEVWTPTS